MTGNSMNSVLTIGDGIAAWCLNFYLTQKGIKHDHFAQEKFFKACSLNSTAINCLRGTQRGISALGDLIYDSYFEFEDFYNKHKPDGVRESYEYQFFSDQDRYQKRFPNYEQLNSHDDVQGFKYFAKERAYLIDPNTLKAWFVKQNTQSNFSTQWVKSLVHEKDQVKVTTDRGTFYYDQVFLCGGDMIRTLGKGLDTQFDTYLDYSKPVTGSYLEVEIGLEYGAEDRSYALDKYHLIIKPSQNKMLLGSTTEQGAFNQPTNEIKEIYQFVKSHFKHELPEFNKWKIKMGIRTKGRKRTPYWGEISPQISVVSGLYKNGYTYAFKAAKDLIISQRTPF